MQAKQPGKPGNVRDKLNIVYYACTLTLGDVRVIIIDFSFFFSVGG